MVEFKVNLDDEPTVFLSSVRKLINDFGEVLVDYSKDENYLMELSDLYDRILEWQNQNQDGKLIPASEYFDASEIDKIMRFMFFNYKAAESLKVLLSSVSYDFYWKYYSIGSWDNSDQNIIQKSL